MNFVFPFSTAGFVYLSVIPKEQKNAAMLRAENWSPESGCLQIWFETAPDGPSPGQRTDANLDFVPVEIRGDTLSATILRERR